MRYYKQVNGTETVAVYAMDGGDVPQNCVEISEGDYNNALVAFQTADKTAAEEAQKSAEEAAEKAQKEAEARQKTTDDYVSKVKAGTVKIDDVPEEYRDAVDAVVNPPKTDAEKAAEKIDSLQKQVDATTEALNSILMTIAQ